MRSTVAALALSVVAATAAWGQEHRHGAAPAAPSPPQGPQANALFTTEDLLFLTHMVMHHQQALEMTAMVPSRSKREEFIRFARYLDGGQRSEIDHMNGLLKVAAERGIEIPHHEMTGDPPM